MLISFGNSGQFGNGYFTSAHRIAHALEYGYHARIYDLGNYLDQLNTRVPHPMIRLAGGPAILTSKVIYRILQVVTQSSRLSFGKIEIIRDTQGSYPLRREELASMAANQTVVHRGWAYRDIELLVKHADSVRRILSLRDDIVNTSRSADKTRRAQASIWIGVHVRRGDYKDFHNGKYYFEDKTYLTLAIQAAQYFTRQGKTVGIIGFSNEALNWPDQIDGIPVLTPKGTWWEDYLSMSLCDLIIGPPSTFSGAASFAGDVPWYQIKESDAEFDIEKAGSVMKIGISV